ncbi:MAG: EamA family transporter [Patescibacteria group bacterium]
MGKLITTPLVLALIAIIIWSFGPALGRFVSLKTQFLLTAIAYTFAFTILLSYFYWTNKKDFVKKLKQLEFKYLLIGLFGYSIFSLSFIQTFRAYNSASEPTILNYTWPIFMVLFVEIFFRLKKKKSLSIYCIEGVGIFLGFIAIILLVTQGNLTSLQIINAKGLL